jgi:NTP pyrophosphatase (non-canonical NTP hydrolase)
MAYATLREANAVREVEWDSGGQLDASFYANELAGEVGEAIHAGRFATLAENTVLAMNELADELADVVICTHLVANKFGVEIYEMPSGFETAESVENELLSLAVYTGQACNIVKKLERERLGLAGSRATVGQLRNQLNCVLYMVHYIAWIFAIRLDVAVAVKFNKTSQKVGLATMMAVPA